MSVIIMFNFSDTDILNNANIFKCNGARFFSSRRVKKIKCLNNNYSINRVFGIIL